MIKINAEWITSFVFSVFRLTSEVFTFKLFIPYENFQRRYNLPTGILIIVLKGFAKYLIEIV